MNSKDKIFNEILGRYVEVKRPVKRLISLSSGLTDTLYSMGVGDIVIATDAFSNKPKEAKYKPKVGSYTHVNISLIENLDPELIVTITGVQRGIISELIKKGFNIYPLPMPTDLSGIISNVIVIGHVTGYIEEARRLALKLYRKINQYISNHDPKASILKTLVVLDFGPVGGFWSPGSPSHICDAIWLVGGTCITEIYRYGSAYIELEKILSKIEEHGDSIDILIYENASYYSSDKPAGLEKVELLLDKYRVTVNRKTIVFKDELLAHTGPWLIIHGLDKLYRDFQS